MDLAIHKVLLVIVVLTGMIEETGEIPTRMTDGH